MVQASSESPGARDAGSGVGVAKPRPRLEEMEQDAPEGSGAPAPKPLTVVMVGGFLLPPTKEYDLVYWGEGLKFPQHRIICVHPSPIASLHDR
jgi:hypothetical protein